MQSVKPGIYRHFKGNCYLVLGVFTHTETKEQYVAYIGSLRFWVRPLDNFLAEVESKGESVPRFSFQKSASINQIGESVLNGKF